jgi:hypothetical protein
MQVLDGSPAGQPCVSTAGFAACTETAEQCTVLACRLPQNAAPRLADTKSYALRPLPQTLQGTHRTVRSACTHVTVAL